MTTAAISIIVAMGGVILALLGLGGGKLWSDAKIDKKVDAVFIQFRETCDGHRITCQKERETVEAKLATSLDNLVTAIKDFQLETQNMLLVGTFTLDLVCRKLKIPESELDRIKINVKNGTYETI